MAVGTATALAVMQPDNMRGLIVVAGAGMIGSVICDIDVSTSESHRDVNKILGITVVVLLLATLLDNYYKLGIAGYFQRSSSLLRLFTGLAVFLGLCVFGKEQPHRSFMHSLLAVAVFGLVAYYIFPAAAMPFAAAMLSHMAIDTLNYKKVRILYPLRGGISFKFCKADGWVNNILFYVGALVTVVLGILCVLGLRY